MPRQAGDSLRLMVSCVLEAEGIDFSFSTQKESIEIFFRRLKSLSILPVPKTTDERGLSPKLTARLVSCRMRLSKFLSKDPPPVNTMPFRREKERQGNAQPPGSSRPRVGKKKTSGQQGARGGRKAGGAQGLG
jgi:hypothetical protein